MCYYWISASRCSLRDGMIGKMLLLGRALRTGCSCDFHFESRAHDSPSPVCATWYALQC
ncbi:hypothetical protein FS749_003487, partial [Ceratobasidium sp. UAMH 11750]